MTLALGPMPERLREVVRRWIEEGRETPPHAISKITKIQPDGTELAVNALFLVGGPSGSSCLDADGEIWNLDYFDDSVTRLEDGPLKVGMISIASDHMPELAEWLPKRPPEALDCQPCAGSGRLPQPHPRVKWQCPACVGLGWVVTEPRD